MKATCVYYQNIQRVGLALNKLSRMKNIHIVPIQGTIVQTAKGVNMVSPTVTILAISTQSEPPILLTNSQKYAHSHAQEVDVEASTVEPRYAQILELCRSKYVSSKNPFALTYSIKGCSLEVAPKEDDRLNYIMHGPSGDVVTESTEVSISTLTQCSGIRAFQYTVKTPTCEREVVVKRGAIEILKEIVHYVNRTFVFVKTDENGALLKEVCVTPTGCCETVNVDRKDSSQLKFVKVPYTKVKIDSGCAVYAVDCTLDILLRQGTLSAALRGGYPSD